MCLLQYYYIIVFEDSEFIIIGYIKIKIKQFWKMFKYFSKFSLFSIVFSVSVNYTDVVKSFIILDQNTICLLVTEYKSNLKNKRPY